MLSVCLLYTSQDQSGTIIPVEITVYEDKSFTFVCKTPPAAILIKEKLGIKSGAGSLALGEHGHADRLARAVRQAHGAAELLVGLAGVCLLYTSRCV